MIKVIENYNLNSRKKRIFESIDDISSICQLIQYNLSNIIDEQDLDDIDQIIIRVADGLDGIVLDERYSPKELLNSSDISLINYIPS